MSVSRGKAAEGFGDWVWRLGLAESGPSVGRGREDREVGTNAGWLERKEKTRGSVTTFG